MPDKAQQPPSLPVWLNLHEATAWVLLRTETAVARASRQGGDAVWAMEIYDKDEMVGNIVDLGKALQLGRLVAERPDAFGGFTKIERVEWSSRPIALLLYQSGWLYPGIKIARDRLIHWFPGIKKLEANKQRKLPPLSDAALQTWAEEYKRRNEILPDFQRVIFRAAQAAFPKNTIGRVRLKKHFDLKGRGRPSR